MRLWDFLFLGSNDKIVGIHMTQISIGANFLSNKILSRGLYQLKGTWNDSVVNLPMFLNSIIGIILDFVISFLL